MQRMLLSLSLSMILLSCKGNTDLLTESRNDIPIPDSATIVFAALSSHPQGWYVGTTYGEYDRAFRLTSGGLNDMPCWSPDKRWIVYTGLVGEHNFGIYKMDYNGEEKKVLTPPAKICQGPRVSPDGRRVAFGVGSPRRDDIFVMDTSGNNWRQVTSEETIPFYNNATFRFPCWAPDGKRIICGVHRYDTQSGSLAIINLDSRQFAEIRSIDSLKPDDPDWSPVRDEIVFVGSLHGVSGTKIFRVRLDGTDLVQLTTWWASSSPRWSADGNRIIFSKIDSSGELRTIWTMNRDGTGQKMVISRASEDMGEADW